jgi:hypothetical protein
MGIIILITHLFSGCISRSLNDNQLTGEMPSSVGDLIDLQELLVEEQ